MNDPSDAEDGLDMAPDEPPVPDDTDPIPLDPEEQMSIPEVEFASGERRVIPAFDLSSQSPWRMVLAKAVLPFLPLGRVTSRWARWRIRSDRRSGNAATP